MVTIGELEKDLGDRLRELAIEHNVPGACVAISDGERTIEAATGVLNLATGVEATTDTLFQIGSITKVWTATLVMQLVDEGKVELDAPVRRYLPGLALSDPAAAEVVTVRQLLTHTSGIDGDAFEDFGRGDECVERYVAVLPSLAQQPPGGLFSYCNAGYVLAGRLVEVLRGTSWDAALQAHLIKPLGLEATVTLPEEALLRRAAIGHLPKEEGSEELRVAPAWALPRALGPAGLIAATASDLLAFARMHLCGGKAADGAQVLSATSVKAMQELQVELPEKHLLGRGWGLGWILYDWGGPPVIGHDGGTIGQAAFLRLVPEMGLAVTLLTNGGKSRALYQSLMSDLVKETTGMTIPSLPTPPDPPVPFEPDRFAGTYERAGVRMEITSDGAGGLTLTSIPTGPMATVLHNSPPVPKALVGLDETTLLLAEAEQGVHTPLTFLDFDAEGRPAVVHSGGRATPRARD